MLSLTVGLGLLMGLVLGLIGGGGSILTVPILLYAAGLGAREAIATSLLVVGLTSLAGTARYARMGLVRWRTGLLFGGVAMVGAYSGGLVAEFVPATALLLLFAAMMGVAGVAMLRRRTSGEAQPVERPFAWGKIILEGLAVGLVTGLVGAGGGFLVVLALVLLGGMGMRAAVGTSLLIIALKSFAGLAGHLNHATIDLQLALAVSGAAVVGTLLGASLTSRLQPALLRKAFGALTLVAAVVMIRLEAPGWLVEAVFVETWPFWAGGAAIAAVVVAFLLGGGKAMGISTGYMDVCAAPFDHTARRSWRLPLLIGVVGGGLAAALLGGQLQATTAMGVFDTALSASLPVKAAVFGGGGVLVGFGARLAGGCTSGHSIVGISQLAPSSLIATGAFMVAGFATTNLLFGAFGG